MPLAPDGIAMCHTCGVEAQVKERASMEDVAISGANPAKNVFQRYGATAGGPVVFRQKLSRAQFGRPMADRRHAGRGRDAAAVAVASPCRQQLRNNSLCECQALVYSA